MTVAPGLPSACDDDRILRQSALCWQEGYRAGRAQRIGSYTIGSSESWSWSSGTIEGKAARLESCQHRIDVNRKH
jgi:hypothetical protein